MRGDVSSIAIRSIWAGLYASTVLSAFAALHIVLKYHFSGWWDHFGSLVALFFFGWILAALLWFARYGGLRVLLQDDPTDWRHRDDV